MGDLRAIWINWRQVLLFFNLEQGIKLLRVMTDLGVLHASSFVYCCFQRLSCFGFHFIIPFLTHFLHIAFSKIVFALWSVLSDEICEWEPIILSKPMIDLALLSLFKIDHLFRCNFEVNKIKTGLWGHTIFFKLK